MLGYTADVLQSAQTFSDHANRPGPSKIEKDDIELAIGLRKKYEFFEGPPRDVSYDSYIQGHTADLTQYLAALAHELNSHPLPVLPESFEVVRLPPPHQRLTEVNFDIVPDPQLVLAENDEEEESSEDEEVPDEEQPNGVEDDADDEDEDMEEVGVDSGIGTPQQQQPQPQPPPQQREVDEDYDV
jgi:transcription initiation factor TFIID subunit 9B